jgi:hypothetical protein
MKVLIEKGYAEVATEMNPHGKVWYFPHQAILSDKKPNKLRIVFDC